MTYRAGANTQASTALARPNRRENARLTSQLLSDPTRALETIAERYAGAVSLGFGPLRMAIFGTPATIREVTSHRADAYVWGHRFQSVGPATFVGRRSMLGSDGADHTRRRGAVQAAFTRQRINSWGPMIVERTDEAIDGLLTIAAPGQPVDLYPIGRRLILGITLQALFGDRWASRLDDVQARVLRAQRFIEQPAIRQVPLPIPVGQRAGVRRDRRVLDEMIDADLAFVRSQPPGSVDGLLGTLAFSDGLSDEEIRDQVVTLIGAGFDTTASTLAWTIVRVARSAEIRSELLAEADDTPEPWTVGDLDYAGRVTREVLRLHPAGVMGVRMAADDMQIGGTPVRRGTMIGWSPYVSGRDPVVWPEPLRFDPDRYLGLDDDQRAQSDLAWIPFGRGPHMCIGFALAQLELTLITARLVQRCNIVAPDPTLPRPTGLIVNRPSGGAVVTVTPRRR